MKHGSKNQIAGKLHIVKGKIKESSGKLISNAEMEAEGKAEIISGKIENKAGKAEKNFNK